MHKHQKTYYTPKDKYNGISGLQEPSSFVDEGQRDPTPGPPQDVDSRDRDSGYIEGEVPKNRKSGAARKRLKILLSQNVEYEEALKLCQVPLKMVKNYIQNVNPSERTCLDDLNVSQGKIVSNLGSQKLGSPSAPLDIPRINHTEVAPMEQRSYTASQRIHQGELSTRPSSASSSREASGSFRFGIQNKQPMTDYQLELVRKAILAAIATSSIGKGCGPRFGGCSHKTGWLLVTCENMESKQWLEQHILTLKPWPEAELSFVDESNLPKPKVGVVFVPSSETTDPRVAIALMRTQNEGLNTELWKILNSQAVEAGLTLTLALDDHSVEAIRDMDYKVQLGFKKVTFRKLAEKKSYDRTPSPQTFATFPDFSGPHNHQTQQTIWLNPVPSTEYSDRERDDLQQRPSPSREYSNRERHDLQERTIPSMGYSNRERHDLQPRTSLSREYSNSEQYNLEQRTSTELSDRQRHDLQQRTSKELSDRQRHDRQQRTSKELSDRQRHDRRRRQSPSTEFSDRERHHLRRKFSTSTDFSERHRYEKEAFSTQERCVEQSSSPPYRERTKDTRRDIPIWQEPQPWFQESSTLSSRSSYRH